MRTWPPDTHLQKLYVGIDNNLFNGHLGTFSSFLTCLGKKYLYGVSFLIQICQGIISNVLRKTAV